MIFAVFDLLLLTMCINCGFFHWSRHSTLLR